LYALTNVRVKSVEFRENVWAFPGTNKTVRNKKVSVLSGRPVKRGGLYVQNKRGTVLFLMVSFKDSKDNNRVIQREQLA